MDTVEIERGPTMAEIMTVQVQELNAKAFRPYGKVLERGQLLYPETDEGRVAIELLCIKRRPNNQRIEQLAVHFSYNQSFIPMRGSLILVVAPPPRHSDVAPAEYDFDYERARAFVVKAGQVVLIEKGVWHNIAALGSECTYVNVTRKNAREKATTETHDGRIDRIATVRRYVGYIDLIQRDNRALELAL